MLIPDDGRRRTSELVSMIHDAIDQFCHEDSTDGNIEPSKAHIARAKTRLAKRFGVVPRTIDNIIIHYKFQESRLPQYLAVLDDILDNKKGLLAGVYETLATLRVYYATKQHEKIWEWIRQTDETLQFACIGSVDPTPFVSHHLLRGVSYVYAGVLVGDYPNRRAERANFNTLALENLQKAFDSGVRKNLLSRHLGRNIRHYISVAEFNLVDLIIAIDETKRKGLQTKFGKDNLDALVACREVANSLPTFPHYHRNGACIAVACFEYDQAADFLAQLESAAARYLTPVEADSLIKSFWNEPIVKHEKVAVDDAVKRRSLRLEQEAACKNDKKGNRK